MLGLTKGIEMRSEPMYEWKLQFIYMNEYNEGNLINN